MMTETPYDYKNRENIRPVSWDDFHSFCKGLAQAIYPLHPELILAVGRGGFYPGTLIAHILQTDLYPICLSRRINDRITYRTPQWYIEPPAIVKDHRIVVIDEICDSGETLVLIKERVERMGARTFKSAVLYAHTWSASVPDYIGLITNALLINPWDREIYTEKGFQFHPEYLEAFAHQHGVTDTSSLIKTETFMIAKG